MNRWMLCVAFGGALPIVATSAMSCGDDFTAGSTSSVGGAAGSGGTTTPTGQGASAGTGPGGTGGAPATGGTGGTPATGGGPADSGTPDAYTEAGPCDTCVDWYQSCLDGPSGSVCDGTNLCPGTFTLISALTTCACSACPVACPVTCPGITPSDECRECLRAAATDFCPDQANACNEDGPTT